MAHVTTETAKKTNKRKRVRTVSREPSDENAVERSVEGSALDRRYRQIGISAVAAAVRYQGVAKNPAYAPAPTDWHDRTEETA
jgi:hypothetical protein